MDGKTQGVKERLWPCWYLEHRRESCFFKALPVKGLAAKKSQPRGGKTSKTRLAIAFFVSAAGEKVIESIVIWRSVKPRCFKNLINPKSPYDVHYHSSQTS